MYKTRYLLRPFACILVLVASASHAETLPVGKVTHVGFTSSHAQVRGPASFAAQHIQAALQDRQLASLSVTLELNTDLETQAYQIKRTGQTVTVGGGDARGVMYGGLELAERIRLGKLKSLTSLQNKPFLAQGDASRQGSRY